MKIALDLRKSIDEIAHVYFEAAKKARRKAKGAAKTVEEWGAKHTHHEPEYVPRPRAVPRRKREWFESFRWCRSSDGLLLLGGRDATTNEVVVKRHAGKGDLLFHTDFAGSPFVVIKSGGLPIPEETIGEAAQFCAIHSRAWRNGIGSIEVFHVSPEQVTKEPNPGEFLPKGAFMIRGKTAYHRPAIRAAVGIDAEGRVMCGPPSAVAAHCAESVTLVPGNEKTSDVAKLLKERLGAGTIDDYVAVLPSGGCTVVAERQPKRPQHL